MFGWNIKRFGEGVTCLMRALTTALVLRICEVIKTVSSCTGRIRVQYNHCWKYEVYCMHCNLMYGVIGNVCC